MTKFPPSTSTPFDDLMMLTSGDYFVLRGDEYVTISRPTVTRSMGIETLTMKATKGPRWDDETLTETRSYIAPLCELLGDTL